MSFGSLEVGGYRVKKMEKSRINYTTHLEVFSRNNESKERKKRENKKKITEFISLLKKPRIDRNIHR